MGQVAEHHVGPALDQRQQKPGFRVSRSSFAITSVALLRLQSASARANSGRFTTAEEIDFAVEAVAGAVERLPAPGSGLVRDGMGFDAVLMIISN